MLTRALLIGVLYYILYRYVHCANYSGEWNDQALNIMAKQPFVVFEKYQKIFEPPICDAAESKIVESCKKVKALNPNTQAGRNPLP